MNQYQDLVAIIPWTLIATVCNLFITVLVMKKFLFKPINDMLARRKAKADAQIQEAEQAKESALSMKAEYEQEMQSAKQQAAEILSNAQRNATVQSEEIIRDAVTQAARIKEQASESIALEKRKAVNEIKDEIGGIAVDIASKVIEREINQDDQAKLIDEFISKVGHDA